MNAYDQMEAALNEARQQIRAADDAATKIARLLENRLHRVDSLATLRALKRELRDFNIHTGRWR